MTALHRLRVWFMRLLARHRTVSNYCKDCGRSCEVYHVADDVWAQLVQPDRELCFRCFTEIALRAGLTVTYCEPRR